MVKLNTETPQIDTPEFKETVRRMEQKQRTMTIVLVNRDKPTYSFEGNWTGRDILVIKRTITFAYRKQQLAMRREVQKALSDVRLQPAKGDD